MSLFSPFTGAGLRTLKININLKNMDYKKIGLGVLIAFLIFVGYTIKQQGGGDGSPAFRTCVVTTTTSVSVGDDISSTVLSATSGRSWARIQQPINATSTVSLSLSSEATVGNGIELVEATTTSSAMPYFEFGMNTDLPYSGIVTGITNGTASTTVLVTECR